MKPNKHNYLWAGLSLAVVSGGSAFGGVWPTSGTNGQLNVPPADNGAHSYILDGHPVFTGPFDAIFGIGTNVTGDAGQAFVVDVTDPRHGIVNWGTLAGSAGKNGITASADILSSVNGGLVNHNTITGSLNGILATSRVDLTNRGLVEGFGGDGASLGANSVVVNGDAFSNAFDFTSGTIRGTVDGLQVGANSTVTNHVFSSIIGGDDGVQVGNGSTVHNYGSVSGNYGVYDSVGDGVTVINHSPMLGGDPAGSIVGTGFSGVLLGTNATVLNETGASITGQSRGVGLSSGVVTNWGSIVGTTIHGIEGFSGDVVVNNYNSIQGSTFGVNLDIGEDTVNNYAGATITGNVGVSTGGGADILNHYGSITGTGGLAIDMGSGDDLPTIWGGGFVNGNIDGGADTDWLVLSGSNTVLGDVFGFERTTKTNGGWSNVEGTLTSDLTEVDQGALSLRGLNASALTRVGGAGFAQFGELGGLNTFTSPNFEIRDRGTVSPGQAPLSEQPWNAIGTLTFSGGTEFQSGSSLRTDINPVTGAHDLLIVDGMLDLQVGSSLLVGPVNVDAPVQDGTRLVLDGNNTSGDFSNTAFHLDGSVVYGQQIGSDYWVTNTGAFTSSAVTLSSGRKGGNDVFLTVSHDYTNIPGLTPSGEAFAGYLNGLLGYSLGDPVVADFLGFLDYSDDLTAAMVINSYDPTLHVTAGDTLIHSGHSLGRLTENHLAMVRRNSAPAVMGAATYDAKGALIAAPAAVGGQKWNAWVTGSFEDLNYERTGSGNTNLPDLDGDTVAGTVGIDYMVADGLAVGVLGQIGRTELDQAVTSVETDSTYFGLYGTYDHSSGFYLNFLAAYGDHETDTARPVFPGISRASYDSDGFLAMIGGGYKMGDAGGVRWGPVAALEYQTLDIDSFTESGPLGLTVNSRDIDSLRLLIGVEAEMNTGRFAWNAALRWAHDFSGGDDRNITAGFAGPGGGFTTNAYDRGEDALLINLGVSTQVTDNIGLGLGYFGEIALDDDGVDAHGAGLEANFSF